jgi:copper oxidase (laccase) domain-containing protein
MRKAGVPADRVLAAIGPGISAEHFEVSQEVAAEFARAGLAEAVRPVSPLQRKPHVDLQRAVRAQLERAGVTHIDGNDVCTFRDAEDFYSHRREGGRTGRMAAVIAARA